MNESGIQINNKPDRVIAHKGSRAFHVLTSKERGENVSIIACANAEGTFLPPVLILKGVRKNQAILQGMPTGSDLYMNKKSSFINSELFLKWMKEVFSPRKPNGPVILIFDGHSSHCNNFETLEYAETNNIILLCLPSHTTQAVQPLDRSLFNPLKSAYKLEADSYMFQSQDKTINRNVIGKPIGAAWNKAATISNATSGFTACGI
ncbi:uncharacterized protein LOC116160204 [Photinus pyralis]|uniref:uncharacterized protein LOC116160204 n=1 Tax=Photinus pyralis TaxID=7054 RepID=UPI0012672E76|nr:uncharacterized protein LOC116160204 [Photinus pyralis]